MGAEKCPAQGAKVPVTRVDSFSGPKIMVSFAGLAIGFWFGATAQKGDASIELKEYTTKDVLPTRIAANGMPDLEVTLHGQGH